MTPVDLIFSLFEFWRSLFAGVPYGDPYGAALTFVLLAVGIFKLVRHAVRSD